jgi:hypothetical protein
MTLPRRIAATLSLALAGLALAAPLPAATAATPAEGEAVTLTGEFIDTWCYFSGVMGGPDAVIGSAHHTCAMWCSAGGIPVGLLAEDGQVYMILSIEGDDATNGGDGQFALASATVTAEGRVWRRDGLNYLVVSKILGNDGITRLTHEDYGPVPDFAVPPEALK